MRLTEVALVTKYSLKAFCYLLAVLTSLVSIGRNFRYFLTFLVVFRQLALFNHAAAFPIGGSRESALLFLAKD